MFCHPSGDAFAQRHPELVRRLVEVLTDLPLHRHRDELGADQPIDPDVVVIDDLAQFRRDGHSDVAHARQVVQTSAELLDRLQLRGPRRHLLVVLGGPDGDTGLGRQGRDRLELVGGPDMGPVVVDVEDAEQVRTVHEGCATDRIEPFLDHRGAGVRSAWVIAVVDGEQGPAGRDGSRGKGVLSHHAHRRLVFHRQPATHLGDVLTVRMAQEDSRAIALEQDHRVVHQPGEDAVQVHAAADVAGNPPKRFRTVDEVRNLLLAVGDPHDRSDRIGQDHGEIQVWLVERIGTTGDDQEDAPWPIPTGDGYGELRAFTRQHGHGHALARIGDDRQRAAVVTVQRRTPVRSDVHGTSQDPEGAWQGQQVRQHQIGGRRDGPRRQEFAPHLPDRHHGVAAGIADGTHHASQVGSEVRFGLGRPERDPRDEVEQGEFAPAPSGVKVRGDKEGHSGRQIGAPSCPAPSLGIPIKGLGDSREIHLAAGGYRPRV